MVRTIRKGRPRRFASERQQTPTQTQTSNPNPHPKPRQKWIEHVCIFGLIFGMGSQYLKRSTTAVYLPQSQPQSQSQSQSLPYYEQAVIVPKDHVDAPTQWNLETLENNTNSDNNNNNNNNNHNNSSTMPPSTYLAPNITSESPLFVLSLPNSGSLALDRYFKCAGLDETQYARALTAQKRHPIVHCLQPQQQQHQPNQCQPYRVWTELQDLSRIAVRAKRQCFFPVMEPGYLDTLFTRFPNATVLNVAHTHNPQEWVDRLSPTQKTRWSKWCPSHFGFPKEGKHASEQYWLGFYHQYQYELNKAIQNHPTVRYVEIDLTLQQNNTTALQTTANILKESLGIPQQCWTNVAMNSTLPRDIQEPIYVTSLPKSATTTANDYLNCGLGKYEGVHKWTFRDPESQMMQIGTCWNTNLQLNNTLSMLENCGDHRFWSDFGSIDRSDDQLLCFYPTMNDQALEAMYQEHPYGTLLHLIRPAEDWYQSARSWKGLLRRWTHSMCQQQQQHGMAFPLRVNMSNPQAWIDFYHQHTRRIQDFAKQHPSMTYIPLYLGSKKSNNNNNNSSSGEEERERLLHQTLQDYFGFPSSCWGHSFANNKHRAGQKK